MPRLYGQKYLIFDSIKTYPGHPGRCENRVRAGKQDVWSYSEIRIKKRVILKSYLEHECKLSHHSLGRSRQWTRPRYLNPMCSSLQTISEGGKQNISHVEAFSNGAGVQPQIKQTELVKSITSHTESLTFALLLN